MKEAKYHFADVAGSVSGGCEPGGESRERSRFGVVVVAIDDAGVLVIVIVSDMGTTLVVAEPVVSPTSATLVESASALPYATSSQSKASFSDPEQQASSESNKSEG